MKLNKIETAVLKSFLNYEGILLISDELKTIKILRREISGNGFMTWVQPEAIKIKDGPESFAGGRIGAKINGEIEAGFVIYIKKSYIDIIEGYTYEELWPSKINHFELYVLP